MQIDLKELFNKQILNVEGQVNFNLDDFHHSEIVDLQKVYLEGQCLLDLDEQVRLTGKIQGIMILKDSYTLELVDYPFNIDIEENIKISKNNKNILDITEVLWQNIVLEVPISFSKNKKLEKSKGNGWELKDKNTKKIDSRLAKLTELLEEGKE